MPSLECGDEPLLAFVKEVFARDGSVTLTVYSGSMWPLIKPGYRVVVTPLLESPLRVGDIAVFWRQGRYLVHRVVRIELGRVIMRGDANVQADPPMDDELLLGRVEVIVRPKSSVRLSSWAGRLLDRFSLFRGRCSIPRRVALTRLAEFMLKTRRCFILGSMYRLGYRSYLKIVTFCLSRVSSIQTIYLCRGMASGHFAPGASDIDLIVVLADDDTGSLVVGRREALRRIRFTKRFCPIQGYVWVLRERDLHFYLRNGGIRSYQAIGWRLLFGKECRVGSGKLHDWRLWVASVVEAKTNLLVLSRNLITLFQNVSRSNSALVHIHKMLVDLIRVCALLEGDVDQETVLRAPRHEFSNLLISDTTDRHLRTLACEVEELFDRPVPGPTPMQVLETSLAVIRYLSSIIGSRILEFDPESLRNYKVRQYSPILLPDSANEEEQQRIGEMCRDPLSYPPLFVTPILQRAFDMLDARGAGTAQLPEVAKNEIRTQMAAEFVFDALAYDYPATIARELLALCASISEDELQNQLHEILEEFDPKDHGVLRRVFAEDRFSQISQGAKYDDSLVTFLLSTLNRLENLLELKIAERA